MPAEYEWECEHCGKTFDIKKECDKHEESLTGVSTPSSLYDSLFNFLTDNLNI